MASLEENGTFRVRGLPPAGYFVALSSWQKPPQAHLLTFDRSKGTLVLVSTSDTREAAAPG